MGNLENSKIDEIIEKYLIRVANYLCMMNIPKLTSMGEPISKLYYPPKKNKKS